MNTIRNLTSVLLLLVAGCTVPLSIVLEDSDVDDEQADGDASLSSLEVIDKSTDSALELSPAFDPEVTEYTASVDGHVVLQVTGTTTDPIFIVVVNGSMADYVSNNEFETGTSPQILAPELITVGVTAADGETTRVYTIDVETNLN